MRLTLYFCNNGTNTETKVEIPNYDIHNCLVPQTDDFWEMPDKEEIDFLIERGRIKVVYGEIEPKKTYKVLFRSFRHMDCREMTIQLTSID